MLEFMPKVYGLPRITVLPLPYLVLFRPIPAQHLNYDTNISKGRFI
jgi:hypothetical protein